LGHDLTYTPLDNSLLFLLAGLTAALRPMADGQLAAADLAPVRGHIIGGAIHAA